MRRYRLLAMTLVVVVALAALAPLGTAAAESDADDLELVVSDDGVVSVTSNGTAVENATVDVTVDDDETYDGADTYTTDEDGEVHLPEPEETVEVTVTASTSEDSVETTATLEADDGPEEVSIDVTQNGDVLVEVTDGNESLEGATVDVALADDEDTENVSYAGTGSYTTDENGTVSLAGPDETVSVTFTATAGDESASTTVTLQGVDEEEEEPENFGQMLEDFKENELTDDEPQGLQIASFVVENNPGNAPDHAGPPSHAGPPGGDNESTQGPPGHAGPPGDENESAQGPPDHAGPPGDDEDDDGQGPPDHAGPGNSGGSSGNSGGGPGNSGGGPP